MKEDQVNRVVKSIDDLKDEIGKGNISNDLSLSIDDIKRQFSENADEVKKIVDLISKEKEKKDLERPFDMLLIPSRGLFYEKKESFLLLNQLTYAEESLLTSEFLVDSGKAMEFVLKSLLVDDSIDPTKLLTGDVQAISLFLRSYAYGDKIDIEFDCKRCETREEVPIRLSAFQMKDLIVYPEDGFISLDMSDIGLVFMIKPLTYFEEITIGKKEMSSLDRLIYMTHSVNGCEDKRVISRVLKRFTIIQIGRFKKYLNNAIPGINTVVNHECGNCGKINKHDFIGSSINTFLKFPSTFRESVNEEIFLITYYGKGVTLGDAKKMPVTERRWFINRISEELDKKQQAEENAQRKANSKSKRR